jgi:hypothetical protein
VRFFKKDEFEFSMQLTLGACSYQAADPGEAWSTADRIRDGDANTWFEEWQQTADRVRGIAEECAAAGNKVSARGAYLRAATYYANALYLIDATGEGARLLPVWMAHRGCFDRFAELCEPPLERVEIPYEGTALPGYFMRSGPADEPRPTVILNNGSDGPISAMWVQGGAAALARGYNALAFDGPGQGAALYLQHLYFRPDWEHVVTPVVDYLLTRPDVDPARIVITGVSQAGYWVPRAVAFEHRIAAAVADPGVVDVSTSWVEHLPPNMIRLLDRGEQEKFDRDISFAEKVSKGLRAILDFRGRPYGLNSPYETFKAAQQYNLEGVVGQIRCRARAVLARSVAAALRRARVPEDDPALHRRRGRRRALRAEERGRARPARLRLARRHTRGRQVAVSRRASCSRTSPSWRWTPRP